MKNKHRGFTIVELVIVIAVIAILAAVLIPTFSAIIKRANISADTQAVRNMNTILASESAESVPTNSVILKDLLKSNGITDFHPQTKFYSFFWLEGENVIILANESDSPVYPEEYSARRRSPEWHSLDALGFGELPQRPDKDDDGREHQSFTVTVTQTGSSVALPFEIKPTARDDVPFEVDVLIPEEYRTDPKTYAIQKVTVIMHDGDSEHKIELISNKAEQGYFNPFELDEPAKISIPYVTGNIEINIDVNEYCVVTFKGMGRHEDNMEYKSSYNKKWSYLIDCESFSQFMVLQNGERIESAIAYTQDGAPLGELYDKDLNHIVLKNEIIQNNLVIYINPETE